jgi:voltage-gated potassium channel
MTDDEPGRERWERVLEWPLNGAGVAFLGAYAWPILSPGLASAPDRACELVTLATWCLFAGDYLARLALSRRRLAFVRSNILGLAVVVLPALRPLRLLRALASLSALHRYIGGSTHRRLSVYIGGATVLLSFVSAVAVLDAERRSPTANIKTFGDAVWWAITTVMTVGYGDRFPTTGTGRVVACGLMLTGIALLGVLTATLASWLVQRVTEVEQAGQLATRRDVEALVDQVAALRAELGAVLDAEVDGTRGHAGHEDKDSPVSPADQGDPIQL